MTAALMDTHVQIASALERGLQLDKVATVATGPKQHDSLTSISGSSGGDEAVPNSSSKRSSRSQVSWSDASPQLRPTVSMSSNGDSVSGMLTRTLSTSRSIGHSLGTTPSLQRRASTTWDFRDYPNDPDDYELLEELGKGASATVYLAYSRTHNAEVALKIVNLDEASCNLDAIVNEVQLMSQQQHPAVLPLYAAFLVDDQLWMVLPYVSGGSAEDILKRQGTPGLNEHVIAVIMRDVASALAYLHKDGIIHRDIKGANILIDQKGQVILADLGVTAQMRTDFRIDRLAAQPGTRAYLERTTFAGTPCWMAPEVMEEDVGYDCSADIWSFGMTLLELATGSAPYAQLSLDQIMIKTMNDDPPRLQSNDRRKKFSEALQDLVAQCLQTDLKMRPSACKILKHKFFKNSYDARYLVERLDVGSGAALAHSFKKNPLRKAKSSIAVIAHKLDDKHIKLAPFEVDVTDAMMLLRHVTKPLPWLPEDSANLELTAVSQCKGLAFAMLKRTGKGGMAPFKGTGFFTGRTVNARRETEWSAPSYFDMCVYGLGPPFRDFKEMDVVMVLPSEAAVDALKEEVFEVETGDVIPEEGPLPPGSPPRASHLTKWKTVKANLLGKTKSIHHGHGHSHSSKPHGAGERLCFGIALERGGEQVYRVPLAGARLTVARKMNAELYGGPDPPSPATILDYRRTKRPPPFERLAAELEQMLEGTKPVEGRNENFMKAMPYYFQ